MHKKKMDVAHEELGLILSCWQGNMESFGRIGRQDMPPTLFLYIFFAPLVVLFDLVLELSKYLTLVPFLFDRFSYLPLIIGFR